MRVEGKDIYHLGFGEAPFPVPECLQQGLRENVDKAEYLPVEGEICFPKKNPFSLYQKMKVTLMSLLELKPEIL